MIAGGWFALRGAAAVAGGSAPAQKAPRMLLGLSRLQFMVICHVGDFSIANDPFRRPALEHRELSGLQLIVIGHFDDFPVAFDLF